VVIGARLDRIAPVGSTATRWSRRGRPDAGNRTGVVPRGRLLRDSVVSRAAPPAGDRRCSGPRRRDSTRSRTRRRPPWIKQPNAQDRWTWCDALLAWRAADVKATGIRAISTT
jgi:hypothetical protein